MSVDDYMKKWLGTFTLPWRRQPRDFPERPVLKRRNFTNRPKTCNMENFNLFPQNEHLDILTKKTCLKASTSVVSLESYSGQKRICQCSGFIMESNNNCNIVLTTARILSETVKHRIKVIVHLPNGTSFDGQIEAYDLHLNVAAVKIQPDCPVPAASLTCLSDCLTLNLSHRVKEDQSFQHHPNSSRFNLIPGDGVIALGRFVRKPYSIMAAPGVFGIDYCDYDCKDLLVASCRITRCGIGGPLINRFGGVIGICLHDGVSTAFLPINIASLWWEHYKKYRQTRRLSLGMIVANLYTAPLEFLERIIYKFPDVVKGVIIEKVIPGSSAEAAGMKYDDVIIQIDGKEIQSVLELYENMWNKVRESVELTLIRASNDVPLHLSMVLDDARSD